MLAWPSSSCTARRSPLLCSRCEAKLWRSMCGCTWVGSPACSARPFSRERTWLAREPRAAPADEQRRLVGLRPSGRAAAARRAAPASAAGAHRHAAPLAALAQHMRGGVGGVDPAGRRAAGRAGPAPPARPRAGRSRTAARRCSGRARAAPGRPRSARWPASATAWSTDSALGSGFGALGARTPSTGLSAPRRRGPTSGTGRARPTARWRCCAAPAPARAAARPSARTWWVCTSRKSHAGARRPTAAGAARRRGTSPRVRGASRRSTRRCSR